MTKKLTYKKLKHYDKIFIFGQTQKLGYAIQVNLKTPDKHLYTMPNFPVLLPNLHMVAKTLPKLIKKCQKQAYLQYENSIHPFVINKHNQITWLPFMLHPNKETTQVTQQSIRSKEDIAHAMNNTSESNNRLDGQCLEFSMLFLTYMAQIHINYPIIFLPAYMHNYAYKQYQTHGVELLKHLLSDFDTYVICKPIDKDAVQYCIDALQKGHAISIPIKKNITIPFKPEPYTFTKNHITSICPISKNDCIIFDPNGTLIIKHKNLQSILSSILRKKGYIVMTDYNSSTTLPQFLYNSIRNGNKNFAYRIKTGTFDNESITHFTKTQTIPPITFDTTLSPTAPNELKQALNQHYSELITTDSYIIAQTEPKNNNTTIHSAIKKIQMEEELSDFTAAKLK